MPPASATAEPDMPAKITLPRMLAWHSPPRSQPTQAVAKVKIRSVMPAEFMMLPIRMNSGAASSGNEFADCAIFCGMMLIESPPNATKAKAASPMVANSGTPSSSASDPDAEDFRHQEGHRPVVSGSGAVAATRPRAASISCAEALQDERDRERRQRHVDDRRADRQRDRLDVPGALDQAEAVAQHQHAEHHDAELDRDLGRRRAPAPAAGRSAW